MCQAHPMSERFPSGQASASEVLCAQALQRAGWMQG